MESFMDRVAVITGAGSGIGRALAIALASEGCHCALVDLDPAGLAETNTLLAPHGVHTSEHTVDVTDRSRMEALPEEVIRAHGKVNLLFNNAGITLQKSFEDHTLEDWEKVLGINLWGVIYGCKFFLPYLKQVDQAHIVNTSSMAAFMGMPTQATYSSTKAAVRAISETLYAELAADGIGVTVVHPGAIKTNIMRAHLAESSNVEVARATMEKVERFAMEPEKAVAKILKAVKKNKLRVVIGIDAKLTDVLKRLMPSLIHKPMVKVFRDQMGK